MKKQVCGILAAFGLMFFTPCGSDVRPAALRLPPPCCMGMESRAGFVPLYTLVAQVRI